MVDALAAGSGTVSDCLTHGAVYEITINEDRVRCAVFLPPGIMASETDDALIQRVHDGMEAALAALFPTYPPSIVWACRHSPSGLCNVKKCDCGRACVLAKEDGNAT
jgi:hypothetical protein